jgi:hypothetical protein
MRGQEGYYYPNTLKKMIIAALKVFNDIIVYDYGKDGRPSKLIEVPIMFGTQKSLHRARTNDEQKQYVPTFPRIELRLNGLTMDEARLTSPNVKRLFDVSDLTFKKPGLEDEILLEINDAFEDFMPLPYNYNFTVNVYSESVDHTSQILENIFPYFAMANSTLRINEFEFLPIERDINITLGNPELSFAPDTLGATDRRTADSNFTMMLEGWMYRKIKSSQIIKTMAYGLGDPDNSADPLGGETFEGPGDITEETTDE